MHNRVIHAPVKDPGKLIDVGCGTGFVTRDLGNQYPLATVYGIDISAVPEHKSTPNNVLYLRGDVRALTKSDKRLSPGTADLIFHRLLIGGMTDWPGYILDMAKLLRPGGWFEVHDQAYPWYIGDHDCSPDWKWIQAMRRGADQIGLDLDCGSNAKGYMENAGLVDVQVFRYILPSGSWLAKQMPETRLIGELQVRDVRPMISKYALPGMTRGLGFSEEEMRVLQEECLTCLAAKDGQYVYFYVTIGRKP